MNVNGAARPGGLQALAGGGQAPVVERGAKREGDRREGGEGLRAGGHPGGRQLFEALKQTLSETGLGQLSVPGVGASQASATGNETGASPAVEGAQVGQAAPQADRRVGQAVNQFMHSLLQALREEGDGSGASGPAGSGGPGAPPPREDGARGAAGEPPQAGSVGESGGQRGPEGRGAPGQGNQYNDLATRLDSLVQNLSSNEKSSGAVSELDASFKKLVSALGEGGSNSGARVATGTSGAIPATAATASTDNAGAGAGESGSGGTSGNSADLLSFLKTFLQNFRSAGGAPSSVGNIINTSA